MIKKIAYIFAAVLLLPYFLVLIYSVIPPISMPIVGEALQLSNVHWRWRSYDKISPNLSRAVIAAEDSRFCLHNGVDWNSVEKVVETAQKKGKLTRGASTIAMQTAKNLFLWVYPTFMRKPLEVPLAMWIDLIWSKKRVLEVYLNIAEMGEHIYGAEAAAQNHFKKPAKKLSARESSFIAASLPNPIKRNAAKPSGYVREYAGTIRARMPNVIASCLN